MATVTIKTVEDTCPIPVDIPRLAVSKGLAYYCRTGAHVGTPAELAAIARVLADLCEPEKKAATPHPSLLFIHGVGLSADCWRDQTNEFAKTHSVYGVDLPGHGRSPPLPRGTAATLATYGKSLVDFLTNGCIPSPYVLIGHSFGAMLAVRAATALQHCCGVIALSAVYQRPPAARRAVIARARQLQEGEDNTAATLARWFGEGETDSIPAQRCRGWLASTRRHNHRGYATAYELFATESGVRAEDLKKLKIPTLFITGNADRNSTTEMAQAMAQHTLAPRPPLTISGAGHMAMLTHAQQVNTAIREFIQTLPLPARRHAKPKPKATKTTKAGAATAA